jgi:hypothetical protein
MSTPGPPWVYTTYNEEYSSQRAVDGTESYPYCVLSCPHPLYLSPSALSYDSFYDTIPLALTYNFVQALASIAGLNRLAYFDCLSPLRVALQAYSITAYNVSFVNQQHPNDRQVDVERPPGLCTLRFFRQPVGNTPTGCRQQLVLPVL